MGADTVDDLHAAEDLAGTLATALDEVLPWIANESARRRAVDAIEWFNAYCRPTCAWLYEGECREADPTCGCLCGHGGE